MSGLFITFEGGDGSGKSTQAELLASFLAEQGMTVTLTREPGGTKLGKQIRQLLLHGDDVAPRAEALLYAADRAHHVDSKIRPALERGEIVIGDRYIDSSVAYQGASRNLGTEVVRQLSMWATTGLLPELTILVDVPAEVAAQRIGVEQDRLESAGIDFHRRVRQEYLSMAEEYADRFVVVDGNRPIETIAKHIRTCVTDFLARREQL